ncbi:MAG: PmoA family protein [Prevotellaceae bacterium]|nr:PmoA family protein [Prevotellaceae bacterium]
MNRKVLFFVMTYMVLSFSGTARKITITVQSGNHERENCVVSADVSRLKLSASSVVFLYEQTPDGLAETPSQLYYVQEDKPVLFWILSGKTPAGTARTFIAKSKKTKPATASMRIEDTQKSLVLKKNGQSVLQYNYAHLDPPPGVDKAYGRTGGYIHPAYSPEGNVLTNIQPRDHYHHFGIWNPWTRVLYDGKRYDLWNIGDKQGTVRARSIENISEGSVFSGFTALLDHYIFNKETEKVIMNEYWKVKTWNVPDGFLWDFESHLMPSTSLPILLEAYRYAGFGWRGTPEWTKENCEMLTSEGKTRPEIDGTNARWIYVTGATRTGRSGLLFMGHPDNYSFPEPLRIWDQNANGERGDAFINFAPTKNRNWELLPNKHYVLKYRVLTFEGNMTPEQANRLWNDFASPPSVSIF